MGATACKKDDPRIYEGPRSVGANAGIAAPQIPDVGELDHDGDRIDDAFATTADEPSSRRALSLRSGDDVVNVEAIFRAPIGAVELDAFENAGGDIRHVFRAVSYGFTGHIPRKKLREASLALGPSLVLLKADRYHVKHMDHATQTGRVRGLWGLGIDGSNAVNVGVLDTGIDATHPDLAGREIGWKDYSPAASATPIDIGGHGTHVTGMILGSGASFGVGPGPLLFTNAGDLRRYTPNDFVPSPFHIKGPYSIESTATWSATKAGTSTTLRLRANDDGSGSAYFAASPDATGTSPLSLTTSGTAASGQRYSLGLDQTGAKEITDFVVKTRIASYPAVGDGFPAFRGVASGSQWYMARIFAANGESTSSGIAEAMDDLIAMRQEKNIKVVNMSFGLGAGGTDPAERAKVNTMVDNGIIVVASAGNSGYGQTSADPGLANNAITVCATNDVNQLTSYTSLGVNTTYVDIGRKPDVCAPGGSFYYSEILAPDSNSAEADLPTVPDVQPNDYTSEVGTSMSSAFMSGTAVLVVTALEKAGMAWGFDSHASPWFVKSLLLASATETNLPREQAPAKFSPTLGRSFAPWDMHEGFGLANPDAVVEAIQTTLEPSFTGTTSGAPEDRRAWGRQVTVPAGSTLRVDLAADAGDFDLYLYAKAPGQSGRPTLLTASDDPESDEHLSLSPDVDTPVWLFVKRIAGSGTFTVTSCLAPDCEKVVRKTPTADAGAPTTPPPPPSAAGDPDAGPAPESTPPPTGPAAATPPSSPTTATDDGCSFGGGRASGGLFPSLALLAATLLTARGRSRRGRT